MKKGIIYERYSSDDQSQHSFERQDIIINYWTNANKIEVLDIFKDQGITGRNFDRPDVQEMLRFIKKNHTIADYVIVSDLSRFSRDAGEAISLVQSIQQKYNVRIVSASRNTVYDCTDSNSFFMMGLEFLLSNSENIKRQNDINSGIYAAKTEKGKWIQGGPAPYGYTKDPVTRALQVKEDDAIIIRFIYKSYIDGMPLYIIKQRSREMGLTKKGNDCINEIVANPLYMSFQKVKPFKEHPGGLFAIKDLPPIVDENTWWAANNMRKNRDKKTRTTLSNDFPLRGMVKCETCGKPLTAAYSTGRSGRKYGYYKCHVSAHVNANANNMHHQLRTIWDYLSFPNTITEAIKKSATALMGEKEQGNKTALQSKRQKLMLLEDKIAKLEEKYISDKIEYDTYTKWKADFSQEKAVLNEEIDRLKKSSNIAYAILEENLQKAMNLRYLWDKVDTLGKQKLINYVFDNSLTYKNGMYRTAFLPLFMRYNILKMRKDNILKMPDVYVTSGEVEATGFQSNQIVDFLLFLDTLKLAA